MALACTFYSSLTQQLLHQPLPEWVAAIDQTKVPAAPIVQMDASGNEINPGYTQANDQYCSWTFTQCVR